MLNEAEEDYLWEMQNLRRVFGMLDIASPKQFVADCEMALMNALGSCFPFVKDNY